MEDILGDLFNSRDKALIKQIPLNLYRDQDCWQWVKDRRGLYTMNSGYHLLPSPSIVPRSYMHGTRRLEEAVGSKLNYPRKC